MTRWPDWSVDLASLFTDHGVRGGLASRTSPKKIRGHPTGIRTILRSAPVAPSGGVHASNVPTRCAARTFRAGRTWLSVARRCPAARRKWRRRGRAWCRIGADRRSSGPRRRDIWREPRGGFEDVSPLFLLPAVLFSPVLFSPVLLSPVLLSPVLLSPVLLRLLPALLFAVVVQSELRIRLVRR